MHCPQESRIRMILAILHFLIDAHSMFTLSPLSFTVFFFKKIRKRNVFIRMKHGFCSLARTTLCLSTLLQGVGIIFPHLCTVCFEMDRSCCNLKPLLVSLRLISKPRELLRSVTCRCGKCLREFGGCKSSWSPFKPINSSQWVCTTHCGQKPLLYLFLLAKNQLLEKWNSAPSDC